MSGVEDLAKTISGIARESSEAMGKMAKEIDKTLQKFRADVNKALIQQFIIYNNDNYIVIKNDSQIIYFKKLVDNELEKIEKEDVPNNVIEGVIKELL